MSEVPQGIYQSSPPALSDNDRANLLVGARGALHVQVMNPDGTVGAAVQTTGGGDTLSNTVNVLGVRSYPVVWSAPDAQWQRLLGSVAHGLVARPFALPSVDWSYAAAAGGIVNNTAVTIKAAAGAGVRNYITSIDVINIHATVATEFSIRDGSGGTVLWRTHLQAAGGGGHRLIQFLTPLKSTANTLLEVICGTTGAAVFFNAQGYTAA